MVARHLTPRDASAWLLERGISRTPSTLAKLRCLGGGPPYRRDGRRVLYPLADLEAWAGTILSPLVRSTAPERFAWPMPAGRVTNRRR